jgi:hypothetical protein
MYFSGQAFISHSFHFLLVYFCGEFQMGSAWRLRTPFPALFGLLYAILSAKLAFTPDNPLIADNINPNVPSALHWASNPPVADDT